ncbi:MAG: hypothetical protein P8Y00_07740, partial [Deltaproteobacteria bacterium]
LYFCRMAGLHLKVFLPKYVEFLMYFSREVVTIDLDKSFLQSPETAREHAKELIEGSEVMPLSSGPNGSRLLPCPIFRWISVS